MRSKLIKVAREDIRQDLYELAQQEQQDAETKLQLLDEWATTIKLREAQKLAHSVQPSDREQLERQIQAEQESQQYRTFKQWVRKQELLEQK
jgi:hypothetical protein